MKILLLHNPHAGDQEYTTASLEKLMRHAGYDPRPATVKEIGENPGLLHYGEFVAVAGGDGSMRKAALGLVGSGQRLAPVPLGTANNFAHSVGVRGTPAEIVAGWSRGETRPIDMGRARGPWGEHWFLEGVGIGLIGRAMAIIKRIDDADGREFKQREDKLRRDLSVLVALAHDIPAVPLRFSADGHETSGDFLLLEIMNVVRAGPGVNMAGGTDISDGRFDLVTARAGERDSLVRKLHASLGDPEHAPILTARQVRHVVLTIYGGEFRLDDEVILSRDETRRTGTSVEITVVPRALNVLVPAPPA